MSLSARRLARLLGWSAATLALGPGCGVLLGIDDPIIVSTSAAPDADRPLDRRIDDAEAGAVDFETSFEADVATDDVTTDTADASPPSWTPRELGATLVVWLDGTKPLELTSAGKVRGWPDQSGCGNHARQQRAEVQPGAEARGSATAVTFEDTPNGGTRLLIANHATTNWGLGDYAVYVLAKYTNPPSDDGNTGYGLLWGRAAGSHPHPGAALYANTPTGPAEPDAASLGPRATVHAQVTGYPLLPTGGVESVQTNLNDGQYHVLAMRRTSAGQPGTMLPPVHTLEVRVDGVKNARPVVAQNVDVTLPIYLGATPVRDGNHQAVMGAMLEVIAITGAVTDESMDNLDAYLKKKYGL